MSVVACAAFRPGHCLVGPQLVYVGAGDLYVNFLCQMGLFWMCNAAAMFCVSLLRVVLVFSLFRVWVPANQESPKIMELIRIKSYNYVWCLNDMKSCRS